MPHRAALLRLAATQDGLITRRQALEQGWSHQGMSHLVGRGEFLAVQPGVYRSAAVALSRAQVLRAVILRSPTAQLSHTTAGQMWDLRAMADPRVHALVPHSSSPRLVNVVVHRCRRIDDIDFIERHDGLRVTSIARTLFDAASVIGARRTESALEQVLDRGLCSIGEVMATVERLAHPHRPGSRVMRSVLASRPAWTTAVQSELELRVARALVAAGFPEPVRQHPVVLAAGFTIHLDLAYPQWKLAIEIDHAHWHAGARAAHLDKERDRHLTAMGWRVVRITDTDVRVGLAGAVRDLRAIVALAS
jgi:hypothetical protein